MQRFADKSLMANIAPTASTILKVLKIAMIIIAALLALVALARPQWGFIWEEAKYTGIDMLIAVDVSKSMLATDVKPNRLERSKFAVKDLVKKLNGVVEDHRVALRNIRRDSNEHIKRLAKDKKISEDDDRKGQDEMQKLTDVWIKKLDEAAKTKEKEILDIR